MTLKKVVQDSSGIVGLFNVEQAAQNIYLAMHAIQHRGQDGVGLAISDGENVVCKKGLGLLSENLKQDTLNSLEGNIAIGQLRMATKNDSQLENVQPIMRRKAVLSPCEVYGKFVNYFISAVHIIIHFSALIYFKAK